MVVFVHILPYPLPIRIPPPFQYEFTVPPYLFATRYSIYVKASYIRLSY